MQARLNKDAEAVREAKIALGEAGPVWWKDGAADFSGTHPQTTPYSDWWNSLDHEEQQAGF